MNIFISQIFIFVCNSIISVIYYKVYNELPGVGADAKTLISVIYYNMYNVTKWAQRAHQNGRKRCTGNTPHLAALRRTRNGATVQRATLHTWQHRGTRNGATVQRATLHTWHHRGTRNENKKNGLQLAARERLKHSI